MDDNLLSDFLAECREHLEGIEADLLAIEEAGESADNELVNKVFRAAHSIKGGSGFFQLDKVKQLAHSIETVLDMMRSGKIKSHPDIINILLIGFDLLRDMVNNIETLEQFDISPNVAALQDLVNQNSKENEKGSMHRNVTLSTPDDSEKITILEVDYQAAKNESQYIYLIEYDLIHDLDHIGVSPVTLLKSLSEMGVIIDTIFNIAEVGTLDDPPVNCIPLKLIYRTVLEPSFINDLEEVCSKKITVLEAPGNVAKSKPVPQPSKEVSGTVTKEEPTEKVSQKIQEKAVSSQVTVVDEERGDDEMESDQKEQNPSAEGKQDKIQNKPAAATPETLRINVEALDTLMAHAGELVLSRNQLVDAISRSDMRGISTSAQRLSYVISELQEAVMQTRLQPVGNVFSKFPRVVRDMSILLKKELRLLLEGKDVELDKTIIEGLSDPLTHMVRNAADHGIESQQERVVKGKPPVGTISLKAFHEAGHVIIEIEDDGKGIDPEKIAKKAVTMGLITDERLKGMTDYDKMALIFLPGLSTANKVTETSGRGVGMDVVKTNLDRLGGKVSIRSEMGRGTSFRIKLPLTLAIIPSLIISEENERYAIPQVNVVELLRIPAAQVKERIQVVGDAEVVVLRGDLIPLVRFTNILGITNTYIDPGTGKQEIDRRNRIADRRSTKKLITGEVVNGFQNDDDKINRKPEDRRYRATSDLNIVIIASGLLQYGLVVGQLHNTEEIVVKPLGRHLKGLQEYAGATIMGDGEVALILDATGIALKSGISSVSAAGSRGKTDEEETAVVSDGTQSFLLFNNQINEQCAIPLDLVQRVENITADQIEIRGGKRTMQYRGASLLLVQLSDVAAVDPIPPDQEITVVVTTVADHTVGLLGIMPVSVLESNAIIDTSTHRQTGIDGSSVIDGQTILIVNIFEIIDTLYPEWNVSKPAFVSRDKGTIVIAEDSDFFRAQIERYITDEGFEVIACADGLDAWKYLDRQNKNIKLVVTDVEMPNMDGLELCKKLRNDRRYESIPVIALTSLASEDDELRGKDAGVTEYQVKLDRDRLIDAINSILGL
ncbi:MAG: response regulator [Fibrobacter sp.]|nr:response regulator [Fibrobacter sp.]